MSERIHRIILGALLIILLSINSAEGVYFIIGLLLFEGLTNLRVTILVSKARFGADYLAHVKACEGKNATIPFDAERMLRLLVAVFLILTYIFYSELLWWFPWFIGIMLCSAGLTGICPMVMMLRAVGFR